MYIHLHIYKYIHTHTRAHIYPNILFVLANVYFLSIYIAASYHIHCCILPGRILHTATRCNTLEHSATDCQHGTTMHYIQYLSPAPFYVVTFGLTFVLLYKLILDYAR